MSGDIDITDAMVNEAVARQAKYVRGLADFLKAPGPLADMLNAALDGVGEADLIDRLADKAEAEATALENFDAS